ncbi:FAD-binding oxidoreductase [Desulfosporosinus metallidurans]|uniref:Glycolate dehydrogenase n=1 Tax=Desulfosporosinus metallidurans TaxID=1888891 RepID=A0A1Q8QHQ7_9FIRM|nr:FAD-linked oxidase C-terminal domain-containing protein [Desulfosporosinus metallidurans]OLN26883.1 Glycolate dehydrogenase [Desulfosporosinus metallidurans]
MPGLVRDLEALLDPRLVFSQPEDLLAYMNDATHKRCMPAAVVQPTTPAEIASVLGYANKHRIPVVPRGAGTGLSGGATPGTGSIVIDLKRLQQVIEVDKQNLTATLECGVVTQKFHTLVESMGLFYPPDPQSMLVCTMGGNVATRAGGPRGVKYGTTKDYVLGVEAVLPDGEIIRYGGKSVKMSSGYDLARLMTGSEGTLGIITKVTVKLLTLPAFRRTMVAVFTELEAAAEAVAAIIAAGAVPSSLELLTKSSIETIEAFIPLGLPKDAEAFLLIELDGHEGKVNEETQQIIAICQENGVRETKVAQNSAEAERMWLARRVLFPATARLAPNVLIEDATVARSQVPAMIREIKRIADLNQLIIGVSGHVGDGNLHPGILTDKSNPELMQRAEKAMGEIAKEALRLGGTLSGEHGIGYLKAPYLEWEFQSAGVDLMRRIKKAFDPHGIMNPGKIWVDGGEAYV